VLIKKKVLLKRNIKREITTEVVKAAEEVVVAEVAIIANTITTTIIMKTSNITEKREIMIGEITIILKIKIKLQPTMEEMPTNSR
jgi:hypothetical protein